MFITKYSIAIKIANEKPFETSIILPHAKNRVKYAIKPNNIIEKMIVYKYFSIAYPFYNGAGVQPAPPLPR